jgi:large subunit ribosomal protein L16
MMVLFPKRYKFLKSFSGKSISKKSVSKARSVTFSNYCLIASQSGFLTNFQIEAMRRYLRRFLKKQGQLFFQVFPNVPITKKPNEIRLGRGKGDVKYWATIVKSGTILIEINGHNAKLIKYHLNGLRTKLPIKTNVYSRNSWWTL